MALSCVAGLRRMAPQRALVLVVPVIALTVKLPWFWLIHRSGMGRHKVAVPSGRADVCACTKSRRRVDASRNACMGHRCGIRRVDRSFRFVLLVREISGVGSLSERNSLAVIDVFNPFKLLDSPSWHLFFG